MTDSEPDLHNSKKRKVAGTTHSSALSTSVDRDDEPRKNTVAPATDIPRNQDPKLLHHLDGYRIIRRSHTPFTSGGFCDIFIGDHQIYGKVAMRRPRMTEKGYTLSEMENFFSESEIWKKLRHPNILQFIGLIQSDGNIWAVSRFAENGSLTTYIKDHPRIDRRILVLQLADAVAYLHRQGVVHGDIKGSNILISADRTVLLSDFGLSKPSDTSTCTSLSGAASIRWCAPELLFDEATKSYASDVYSFGMTVYEILSGNVPFYTITNDIHLINAIKDDRDKRPPREPLASESEKSYEPLWDIASESWDGNPSNRPTMEAICVRLGVPVQVTSPSGTTAEETSIVESVAPHLGGPTSAHVAEDAVRRFDQPGAGPVAKQNAYNTTIQQSNKERENLIRNIPTGTSFRIESTTEEEYRKKQEDERLIREMPHAHARYDDTSTKPSRPCHPNTRTDLRQTIGSWIDDESSAHTLFWLCGEVGVGKTTVAHTIAKERDASHQLAASFFFNRDHSERRNSLLFASTIAYQLARYDPEAYQVVVDTLRRNPDIVHRNIQEQFSQLVMQPLAGIVKAPPRTVLIVIDGLDECDDPVSLLDTLTLLTEHTGSRLRVLITSRPHAAIVTKFENTRLCHLTSQSHFRDIDSDILDDDVRAYLEWSLGDIASEFQNSVPYPWPSPDQIDQIVRMADGLFVLASIFDRYIRDPGEGKPARQLERILSRRPTRGGSPTAELDSMYDLVLNDIKTSLSQDDVAFARTLMQLIFLSSYQMSVTDMSEILDCDPDDVQFVVRRMTSVIRLPSDEDEAITPFHASFGEYVRDPKRCSVKEFMIEPALSHAKWAIKFLEIFIQEAETGITGVEYDYGNFPPRKLQIAARELPHHVSLASDPIPAELQQAQDRFCRDAIRTWVFVWYWSVGDDDDKRLVMRIKEAGFTTSCNIEDEASLQLLMVKHILDQTPHLAIHGSSPLDGESTTHDGSRIFSEADFEVLKIKLQWSSSDWAVNNDDPRYFARMLWKWSRIEHSNIVPLSGISFESLRNLSEQSSICVPMTSHYTSLKHNWYPALLLAFQQNSEEAVKMALGVARALQYLQESGFYESTTALIEYSFRIEDIVLSKEGNVMIHPAFLVYKGSADPSLIDAERQLLAQTGFMHWDCPESNGARRMIWEFGCVTYEMMTGEPPLKRFHDIVMGTALVDSEPMYGEAPPKAYRDLVKSVEMSTPGRLDPLKVSDYWPLFDETRPGPGLTFIQRDIHRQRYQTAVDHLLKDLRVSEDLKDVLRACWTVNEEKRPPIQDIVARLTHILEGLRNQNPEGM